MQLLGENRIDWARFALVCHHADRRIHRLLGYYREDSERALEAADQAARSGNLVAMLAHLEKLRQDSMQVGALGVAELAETVENEARDMIDHGLLDFAFPPGLPALASRLQEALAALEAEVSPAEALRNAR